MKLLTLTALAAGLLVAPAAQAAPEPRGDGTTVTLPTGDRVRLLNGTVAGIDPGPGRDHIAFQQIGTGRDLTVLPADALRDPSRFRLAGPAPARRSLAAEHGLKVEVLDRSGRPLPAVAAVTSRDDPAFGTWTVAPGEEMRVPPGRYAVHVLAPEPGGSYLEVMDPEVRVDGDTTATLDGRGARRVGLSVARPTARATRWAVGMALKAPPGAGYAHNQWTAILPDGAEIYANVPDPTPDLVFDVRGTFQEPLIRLDAPFPVDVSYAGSGSPRLLGTHALKAVTDLKNATGALVVLDGAGEALPERVRDVAAAGGKAVLLVGDPPRSSDDLALPTLTARGEAAERLRRLAETAPAPVTTRGIEASPYNYAVMHPTTGRVPENAVYRDRDEDLAAGRVTYRAPGAPGTAYLSTGFDSGELSFGLPGQALRLPSTRTEYFSAGQGVAFGRTLIGEGDGVPFVSTTARARRPGERFTETVLKGVLGPWLATPYVPVKGIGRPAWVYRRDDVIDVRVPTFTGDGPDHFGVNYADSERSAGTTRLHRNGVLVGETPEPGTGTFTVPSGPGSYRLDVEANVGAPGWRATTGVRASWTFASAGGGGTTPLPLTAVRFAPSLNDLNQGPAGSEVTIPVRVEHQAGATPAPVTSLAVKASYDNGTTWQSLPVVRLKDHWTVRLRNPAQGGVSLRALVRDASGTTLDQTVRTAYTVDAG